MAPTAKATSRKIARSSRSGPRESVRAPASETSEMARTERRAAAGAGTGDGRGGPRRGARGAAYGARGSLLVALPLALGLADRVLVQLHRRLLDAERAGVLHVRPGRRLDDLGEVVVLVRLVARAGPVLDVVRALVAEVEGGPSWTKGRP